MKQFYSIFFLLLIAVSSCTTTKVYTPFSCKVCLSPADGILLLPLAWEPSFRLLSVSEKNQLERQILADLRSKGFTNAELYDGLDYELLKAGIKDLNDPLQRAKINSELGYSYLLALQLGDTREGEGWSYLRPEEVGANVPVPDPDMEVSANLRVVLIETATGGLVSDNAVMAESSGFGKSDDEGGTDFWNFSTISGVVRTGVQKGISFVVKDCSCR